MDLDIWPRRNTFATFETVKFFKKEREKKPSSTVIGWTGDKSVYLVAKCQFSLSVKATDFP